MLSDTVGEQVTYWRKKCGWNRERLAEECARIGMPELTAAVLTNIESGRRNTEGVRRRTVSVDELMVLAYALNITPLALISQYPKSDVVEVLPNTKVPVHDVLAWIAAQVLNVQRVTEDDARYQTAQAAWAPIYLLREHEQRLLHREQVIPRLLAASEKAKAAQRISERSVAREQVDRILDEIEGVEYEIRRIRNTFRNEGWEPPPLPDHIEHIDQQDFADNKAETIPRFRRKGDREASVQKIIADFKEVHES